MGRIKLYNGNVITPYRIIRNACVLVENSKISYVGEGNVEAENCVEIDARGCYISPGFIDIHTHGGGGFDFMETSPEAYTAIAEVHARHGTTSMVATVLYDEQDKLNSSIEVFDRVKAESRNGAEMLGIHIEGPYFALPQKGAIDPRFIKNPDKSEYASILEKTNSIIRWCSAPELKGALEFGKYIKGKGILPSIGHTDAVYQDVLTAFENGFTHITHIYSGMSGVRRINAYRYAGAVESAFLIDDMTVEVIADGCHLPPCLLQLVYKIKGPDRIALITDSMSVAGLPEGKYDLSGLDKEHGIIIEDGVAKLPDRSAFAGSVATTDRLVRTMIQSAGIPLIDAVRMMTATPAQIIGVGRRKGVITKGMDADIVIFDSDINVKMVMVNGRIINNG